jgi:hypothetical protein
MVEGKFPVWTQISQKYFLANLIGLLKTRDSVEVQIKILYLIKKWGTRFDNQKEILPNFTEIYNSLKSSGVAFPDNYQADYYKYTGEEKPDESENLSPKKNPYANDFAGNAVMDNIYNESSGHEASNLNIDLNPENYEKKYKKFVSELSVLIDNINLANEMMDNLERGNEVDEGLRTIIHNLRDLEKNLVSAIQGKIHNEKLLEICLGINDDINRTFTRYDLAKQGKPPGVFLSVFVTDEKYAKKEIYKKSSSPVKKPQPQQSGNLLDFGGLDTTSSSSNMKQQQNQTSQQQNKNDIFDIFGAGSTTNVTNVSQNQGSSSNFSNQNPSGNEIFSFTGQQTNQQNNQQFTQQNNSNPIDQNQMNQSSNMGFVNMTSSTQNQNKNPLDLLSEKLKNVYSGNDNTGVNNNMNNMNQFQQQGQRVNFNINLILY